MWCDLRIVDERAKVGLLNKRWGLSLADGGIQRRPRAVGLGNALYMIETGIEIDAQRTADWPAGASTAPRSANTSARSQTALPR